MFYVTLEDGTKVHMVVKYHAARHVAVAVMQEGEAIVTGVSHCHPGDQFVRVEGRTLALDRALKASALTREQRRQVWNALRAKGWRFRRPVATNA